MAQQPRIAMATVMVVVSALGALTGSTSSSTWLTTASASARPTNTTNAYILLPPLRRTARRSPQFDQAYDAWLQPRRTFFSRNVSALGRSDLMNVDPALVKACQRGDPGALDELI